MPRRREFAYLTTTGRRTGREHTVELCCGVRGDTLYFLSGGGERADWIRNANADPRVRVRLGRETVQGSARSITDPDEELAANARWPRSTRTGAPANDSHRGRAARCR